MTPISVQKLGAMEPTNGLCREEVDKTQISGRISGRICPQAELYYPQQLTALIQVRQIYGKVLGEKQGQKRAAVSTTAT